jgi:hypothetical protein
LLTKKKAIINGGLADGMMRGVTANEQTTSPRIEAQDGPVR